MSGERSNVEKRSQIDLLNARSLRCINALRSIILRISQYTTGGLTIGSAAY